jgi:hypothetical protein
MIKNLLMAIAALVAYGAVQSHQEPKKIAPQSVWVAMFFASSCNGEQADVTYAARGSIQQEKDVAPSLVGNVYPLRSGDFFSISAQDDPFADDNGTPLDSCADVVVSIWSFKGTQNDADTLAKHPTKAGYAWIKEHGKILNRAESTERYGIADTSWGNGQ